MKGVRGPVVEYGSISEYRGQKSNGEMVYPGVRGSVYGAAVRQSKIQNPKSNWRRRVGVEPTQVRSRALADGFEDRAHHRTGCASEVFL